ncbi:MAG: alpha/beta fold hydrolase, partial [Stackebrandtia sp.]
AQQAIGQAAAAMEQPWPAEAWPDVPTRFLLCRDDRLFPADWMRSLVKQRLDLTPDEMDGGHYVALSRPVELAEHLDAYVR